MTTMLKKVVRNDLRNNSWKPEFVSSFNMGNIILRKNIS